MAETNGDAPATLIPAWDFPTSVKGLFAVLFRILVHGGKLRNMVLLAILFEVSCFNLAIHFCYKEPESLRDLGMIIVLDWSLWVTWLFRLVMISVVTYCAMQVYLGKPSDLRPAFRLAIQKAPKMFALDLCIIVVFVPYILAIGFCMALPLWLLGSMLSSIDEVDAFATISSTLPLIITDVVVYARILLAVPYLLLHRKPAFAGISWSFRQTKVIGRSITFYFYLALAFVAVLGACAFEGLCPFLPFISVTSEPDSALLRISTFAFPAFMTPLPYITALVGAWLFVKETNMPSDAQK